MRYGDSIVSHAPYEAFIVSHGEMFWPWERGQYSDAGRRYVVVHYPRFDVIYGEPPVMCADGRFRYPLDAAKYKKERAP